MVPAYNDSLGGMAGIWAVKWRSLDATAWLYYAASGICPFDTWECQAPSTIHETGNNNLSVQVFPNPAKNTIKVNFDIHLVNAVIIYNSSGIRVAVFEKNQLRSPLSVDVSAYSPGFYFITAVDSEGKIFTRKFEVVK
jgi:hypothetical protein